MSACSMCACAVAAAHLLQLKAAMLLIMDTAMIVCAARCGCLQALCKLTLSASSSSTGTLCLCQLLLQV